MGLIGHTVATVSMAAAAATTVEAQITLTRATEEAGLTSLHVPDADGIPLTQEWMTGGLGIGDFNDDGCMDVFWVGGGLVPDRLFINDCDGSGHFTDQAAAWGVAVAHCGNGVAVGDYDADGLPDIFVTSFGLPGSAAADSHRLYHNDGGSFSEVAVFAGVAQSCQLPEPPDGPNPAGYGAAFGDYDLDGLLDLAVTSWWGDNPGAGQTSDQGTRLYHNDGDGTFTDVTEMATGTSLDDVWGFQPAFVDMDGDRFPELLIAADFVTSKYLVNSHNGAFVDFTELSGTGIDENGMGQAVADFNNDGVLDWYVTSIHKDNPQPGDNHGNMLYMGQGTHLYTESSVDAEVNDGGWGWGTLAIDLDHDGWVDIVEVNGRDGSSEWENERGYLFRNDGDGTFTEVAMESGFDFVGEGRALAYLDADEDGDLDVLVFENAGSLLYYRNEITGARWLRLLFDTSGDPRLAPDGFGTRVIISAGAESFVDILSSDPSYLATSEPSLHFGLSSYAVVDELRVEWATGAVTILQDVPTADCLTISAPTPGDLDGSGAIDTVDFLDLLAGWGPCPAAPTPCLADLNGDGAVDTIDFLELLSNWG